MIKARVTDKGRVTIKDSCKEQSQFMGEACVLIKWLVHYAMLRAKKAEKPAQEFATAMLFGKVFDESMSEMESMIAAGIDLNGELESKDIDITVDMNDIDEIMKQLKEMQDGEES